MKDSPDQIRTSVSEFKARNAYQITTLQGFYFLILYRILFIRSVISAYAYAIISSIYGATLLNPHTTMNTDKVTIIRNSASDAAVFAIDKNNMLPITIAAIPPKSSEILNRK